MLKQTKKKLTNKPTKPILLSMQWNLKHQKETMDKFDAEHSEDTRVPLSVLNTIYKGDLLIGLKKGYISSKQSYTIVAYIQTKKEIIKLIASSKEPMLLDDFLGQDTPRETEIYSYYDSDDNEEYKWDGYNHLLQEYIKELEYSGEVITDINLHLECTTQFKSMAEFMEFNRVKMYSSIAR